MSLKVWRIGFKLNSMFSRLSRVFPMPLNSSHWSSPHPHRCSCSPFLYNPKELASIFTPHVPGNISLVVPAWTELPTSPCMNCILLSEFTGILPALPVALTPATDMWALTHDSSQHLSCFPKSKSSDQAHHQVQIWSTLKKLHSVTRCSLLEYISCYFRKHRICR